MGPADSDGITGVGTEQIDASPPGCRWVDGHPRGCSRARAPSSRWAGTYRSSTATASVSRVIISSVSTSSRRPAPMLSQARWSSS